MASWYGVLWSDEHLEWAPEEEPGLSAEGDREEDRAGDVLRDLAGDLAGSSLGNSVGDVLGSLVVSSIIIYNTKLSDWSRDSKQEVTSC